MGVEIKSVLISDAVDQQCAEILKSHNISVTYNTKLSKEELIKEIQNHDALIVRSATQVTKDVLHAGTRLKVVGRAGAGVDNIDVAAATERKIAVLNAPGANALSACEMTCALLLNLARHIPKASTLLKAGKWERTAHTGTELYGKTLAVLGLGRVGREVAIRMSAFGMKIIGYDPIVSAEDAAKYNTTKLELDAIWPLADYITVHTPLLPSTRNLINGKVLRTCKKGVRIVNVGRGGLVDESALLENLNTGHVAGAALDVFETEPPTEKLTLEVIQHRNVIATPHLGASTKEAQIRVGLEIAEQFVNLVKPNTYSADICAVNQVL